MNKNEQEFRMVLFAQLLAGLYMSLYTDVLRDYAAKEIATTIVYGGGPVFIAKRYMSNAQAEVIARMGKTLWTMIRNSDMSLLMDPTRFQ